MITYKQVETAAELQAAFQVRQIVFTQEQGIDAKEDFDVNDIYATHFVAVKEDKIIGTVRVFPNQTIPPLSDAGLEISNMRQHVRAASACNLSKLRLLNVTA